ncbi:MAG: hypothetical protein ACPL7B_03435 [Candidatus Poribacteria bacterium]
MAENMLDAQTHRKNRYIGMENRYGYLQFMYHNPVTNSNVPFPSGTPVNIIYFDNSGAETPHSGNPLSTNAEGKITFFIEHRTNLYFEFNFSQQTYINITSNTLINDISNLDTARNMVFMLPQRFNLKNSKWTIDSVPVYDTTTRTFRNLEANPLSGAGGHLPVVLTPEWQYIGFQFYDKHAKTRRMVPQFIVLDGYNEDIDAHKPVTRSNIFKDNCICLPWIEDRNLKDNRNAEKIVLGFRTINAYVDSGAGIARHTRDETRAMPLKDRFKHYDLPEVWSSKNWDVKIGQTGTNYQSFNNPSVVNGDSTPTSPIVFELDTVVITNNDLRYESSWNRDNRFASFNIQMVINNPDTDKPYWTQGTVERNFFPMNILGDHPRVLAVNGQFYDITDKRSIAGDVIGARAAVLNDESVHYGDDIVRPVTNIGNFDLHYFKDCLDSSNNPVSALLIYWSCKFVLQGGATNAHLANFQRYGMINAKNRWEHKRYRFISRANPSSGIQVVPVYFFEARESDPFKCTVNLRTPSPGARSNMGVSIANFKTPDYRGSGTASIDIDGNSYNRFTMAHELGHAVGLDDEYLESLSEDNPTNAPSDYWSPSLPKFIQYYPGMPYSSDPYSMMHKNIAPRLRHFWYFCRWMNETNQIKSLTNNTEFEVNYSNQNFNYYLDHSFRNFYVPVISETNYVNGSHGQFDLHLYKIGQDETTKVIYPGKSGFDGILVVLHKIQWFFENQGSETWTDIAEKLRYLRNFRTTVDLLLNQLYYLENSSDADFKKVYIHFVPHFHYEGGATGNHFSITVKANKGTTIIYQPDFFKDGFVSHNFVVDEKQGLFSIYRYVLGLRPYYLAGTNKMPDETISTGELNFLATWLSNKRGGTYQLVDQNI